MKSGSHEVPVRAPPPPSQTVRIHWHMTWWLRLYLQSLVMVATLTGSEPDWDKVKWWVERGVQIKVSS